MVQSEGLIRIKHKPGRNPHNGAAFTLKALKALKAMHVIIPDFRQYSTRYIGTFF